MIVQFGLFIVAERMLLRGLNLQLTRAPHDTCRNRHELFMKAVLIGAVTGKLRGLVEALSAHELATSLQFYLLERLIVVKLDLGQFQWLFLARFPLPVFPFRWK